MSAKSKCYCSFCGKRDDEVPKMIAGPASIYICNECVELSAQICVADGIAIDPLPGIPLPQQENTMRTEPEQALALECLRLAISAPAATLGGDLVADAERFYAFVTGADRSAAADVAKAAIDELAR